MFLTIFSKYSVNHKILSVENIFEEKSTLLLPEAEESELRKQNCIVWIDFLNHNPSLPCTLRIVSPS